MVETKRCSQRHHTAADRRVMRRLGALLTVALFAAACGIGRSGPSQSSTEQRAVATVQQAIVTVPPPPDFDAYVSGAIVDSDAASGKPVGALPGESTVTADGAFAYAIPLEVPRG